MILSRDPARLKQPSPATTVLPATTSACIHLVFPIIRIRSHSASNFTVPKKQDSKGQVARNKQHARHVHNWRLETSASRGRATCFNFRLDSQQKRKQIRSVPATYFDLGHDSDLDERNGDPVHLSCLPGTDPCMSIRMVKL